MVKDYVTAFFMAWGNFLTIPCPLKRWDSKLNNLMLAMLPLMGLIIGGIWGLGLLFLRYLNDTIGFPTQVGALFAMGIPFLLCGLFHLDGFMDVADAVLSRRELQERRRILKDPTVGAFAVICVVFLLLAWYAALSGLWEKGGVATFVAIPVFSRSVAGGMVILLEPMESSQYNQSGDPTIKNRAAGILAGLMAFLLVVMIMTYRADPAVLIVTAVATLLWGLAIRGNLKGMNGDIAGASICLGEITGLLIWSLIL